MCLLLLQRQATRQLKLRQSIGTPDCPPPPVAAANCCINQAGKRQQKCLKKNILNKLRELRPKHFVMLYDAAIEQISCYTHTQHTHTHPYALTVDL